MQAINLPFSITYETTGATPIPDIVAALEATEALARDMVSLLPSLYPGLSVQKSSVNVRQLTQESPLRELFLVSLVVAFQSDLETEVPPVIEDMFNVTIDDRYDTIATVLFMIVAFYGVALAKDAVSRLLSHGRLHQTLDGLIAEAARETNKSKEEIKKILDAKYSKPTLVRRLAKSAVSLFLPSRREGSAPVVFDRRRVEPPVIAEIPFPGQVDSEEDFERYTPISEAKLILHAQDRDKNATGWAAVVDGLTDKRLRLKLIEPVRPSDLWGKDIIIGDIVVVNKITGDGFTPSEVHLTRVA